MNIGNAQQDDIHVPFALATMVCSWRLEILACAAVSWSSGEFLYFVSILVVHVRPLRRQLYYMQEGTYDAHTHDGGTLPGSVITHSL